MTRVGCANANWRGGVRTRPDGYRVRYAPDHPAVVNGGVLEHRLIVEVVLGRPLASDEVVHHINGDKGDNRSVNLAVMSQADHARLHDAFGDHRYIRSPVRIDLICERCDHSFTVTKTRDGSRRFCGKVCYMAYRRVSHHSLEKGEPA